MGDVLEMLEQLQKLQSARIAVHEERCAVVRNRHAGCRRCAQACTTGCISIEGDELRVDADKCIGCGTCATLCPTGALEACTPDDAELYRLCAAAVDQKSGTVRIACERALGCDDEAEAPAGDAPAEPGRVVCLGRVEESLMAMLACNGAKRIELVCSDCKSCPYEHGERTARQACATANELFKAWQMPARASLVEALEESAPDRQAGGAAGNEGQDDAVAGGAAIGRIHELGLQKVGKDGTLPHAVPGRRRRLLAALDAGGEPLERQVSTRLWGHVEIDLDKCESCRMCAVFCPTAAISKFDEEDGSFGVEHCAGRCVKCESCVDICPAQAITLHDDVSTGDLTKETSTRFEMKARPRELGGSDQAQRIMRELLKCDQVYNR